MASWSGAQTSWSLWRAGRAAQSMYRWSAYRTKGNDLEPSVSFVKVRLTCFYSEKNKWKIWWLPFPLFIDSLGVSWWLSLFPHRGRQLCTGSASSITDHWKKIRRRRRNIYIYGKVRKMNNKQDLEARNATRFFFFKKKKNLPEMTLNVCSLSLRTRMVDDHGNWLLEKVGRFLWQSGFGKDPMGWLAMAGSFTQKTKESGRYDMF